MIGESPTRPAPLVRHAASGGGRREIAAMIARHCADGTESGQFVTRAARTAQHALELPLARLGAEVIARDERDTLLEGKFLGPFPDQQHVRGVLQNEARKLDGVLDVPQPRDRPRAQLLAVHDRRVKLRPAVMCEYRAAPRIKEGLSSSARTAHATASRLEPSRSSTA